MKIIRISIYYGNLLLETSSNLLVIGDFNYLKTVWDYYNSKNNDMNLKTIGCIKDWFVEHYAKEPTQGRDTNNLLLLDLVLNNKNNFIDVSVDTALGKSNYNTIEVNMQNYPPFFSYTEIWDYNKVDFEKMKSMFNEQFNTSIKMAQMLKVNMLYFIILLLNLKGTLFLKMFPNQIYTITM